MASRVLAVLNLFRREPGAWTVDAIAREMNVSPSSAYRDVHALCRDGFLDPVTDAGYVLGPAFVEYDRLTRRGDALIRAAASPLRALLAATTQNATAILCRRYRDTVMCVHQEHGTGPHPDTAYERGVSMPLFVGASSKVILAHLDIRALRRIHADNETAIQAVSPEAADWAGFRTQLSAIRRQGFAVSRSEVAPGRAAVAAPVHAGRQAVAGISLILSEEELSKGSVESYTAATIAAGRAVSAAAAHEPTFVARG